MPFEPGVLPSRRVPRLVLVVDVSGSIDEPLLQRFAREMLDKGPKLRGQIRVQVDIDPQSFL